MAGFCQIRLPRARATACRAARAQSTRRPDRTDDRCAKSRVFQRRWKTRLSRRNIRLSNSERTVVPSQRPNSEDGESAKKDTRRFRHLSSRCRIKLTAYPAMDWEPDRPLSGLIRHPPVGCRICRILSDCVDLGPFPGRRGTGGMPLILEPVYRTTTGEQGFDLSLRRKSFKTMKKEDRNRL
jgi:hypothetical protein